MNASILAGILRDAGTLLALAVIFDLVTTRLPLRVRPYRSLAAGIAVGLLGIAIMATPLRLQDGVVFDARSVLLAVSGLFFGAGATLVAMAVTAAFRIIVGGSGALTGVLVIAVSGALGIAWHARRRDELERIGLIELYVMGLVVHVAMLGLMLTLPAGMAGVVLDAIALPVMVVFPVATAALGALMANRLSRERVGAQLEESEARYRSLFENNHAVMLLVDPDDGRIIDANPAAARFYGWSRSELQRRSVWDVNVLPESEIRAEIESARRGERNEFRFRHRLASGEIRDVEVASGVVPVHGRPVLYSIIHDVTSERIALEALRLRSAALDAAANAIIITDREGSIEWVNAAFTRLYGYTPEEALGRNPRDLVKSGVHDADFYAEMWRTLRSGETWQGRIMNRRRDGSLFEADLAITPLPDATGETAHYIAVKQDLTRWRELEQRLALAQKLESVGQLAGGVAHDFNNLLTVINGTLDLVLGELPAEHPIRADLEEVRRAGQRAGDLTRQLLAFGRRQVLRKEAVDLNALIRNMSTMLRRVIGEHIRIVDHLAPDVGTVFADPGQLEQVILNLVLNARDAMPAGGVLTLSTESLPAGAGRAADGSEAFVQLTIRDTGVGIEPAVRERIFDPFFTTKESGKGTGLGLATVYGIVTQSGGEIEVESTPGRGSAFAVRLPRGEAAPRI